MNLNNVRITFRKIKFKIHIKNWRFTWEIPSPRKVGSVKVWRIWKPFDGIIRYQKESFSFTSNITNNKKEEKTLKNFYSYWQKFFLRRNQNEEWNLFELIEFYCQSNGSIILKICFRWTKFLHRFSWTQKRKENIEFNLITRLFIWLSDEERTTFYCTRNFRLWNRHLILSVRCTTN